MSVTFWCPEAPTQPAQEECYCVFEGAADPLCTLCSGSGTYTHQQSVLPAINVTSVNAGAILQTIAIGSDESCGTWTVEQLDLVIMRLRSLLTQPDVMAAPPSRESIVYYCGRSADYGQRRFSQLLELAEKAKAAGYRVTWG